MSYEIKDEIINFSLLSLTEKNTALHWAFGTHYSFIRSFFPFLSFPIRSPIILQVRFSNYDYSIFPPLIDNQICIDSGELEAVLAVLDVQWECELKQRDIYHVISFLYCFLYQLSIVNYTIIWKIEIEYKMIDYISLSVLTFFLLSPESCD